MAESSRRKLAYSDRYSNPRQSRLPVTEGRRSTRSLSQQTYNRTLSARKHSSYAGDLAVAGTSSASASATFSTNLRRYGSDYSLGTPSHFATPIHSHTPSSSRKMPTTVDRETIRKATDENITKVLKVLQQDRDFYSSLKLTNGLKGVTTKQFQTIISYFARFIQGKGLVLEMNKAEEEIIQFLNRLRYPGTINKSTLKTPNTKHTFDQSMTILSWLTDFISTLDVTDETHARAPFAPEVQLNVGYARDEMFPSVEFTEHFSKSVLNGFKLWNERSEEFNGVVAQLANDLVAAKMNGRIQSVAELQTHTTKMKQKTQRQELLMPKVKNAEKFKATEMKFKREQKLLEDLEQKLEPLKDQLGAITLEWNDKKQLVEQKQAKITQLKKCIKQQKHNLYDMRCLGEKQFALRNDVQAIRAAIQETRNKDALKQIQLARLIKAKSDVTMQLNTVINNYLCSLLRNKENLKLIGHVEAYTIYPESIEHIEHFTSQFTALSSKVNQLHKNYSTKIESTGAKNKQLSKEIMALNEKLHNNKSRYQKNNDKLIQTIDQVNETRRKCETKLEDLVYSAEEGERTARKLVNDIKAADEKQALLEKQNDDILKEGNQKINELLEIKREIIRELDAAIAILDTPAILPNNDNDNGAVAAAGIDMEDEEGSVGDECLPDKPLASILVNDENVGATAVTIDKKASNTEAGYFGSMDDHVETLMNNLELKLKRDLLNSADNKDAETTKGDSSGEIVFFGVARRGTRITTEDVDKLMKNLKLKVQKKREMKNVDIKVAENSDVGIDEEGAVGGEYLSDKLHDLSLDDNKDMGATAVTIKKKKPKKKNDGPKINKVNPPENTKNKLSGREDDNKEKYFSPDE